MRRTQFFWAILVYLGIFLSTEFYAEESQFDVAALTFLEESQDAAIIAIVGDEVYLNPERVIVGEEGIFLSAGHSLFRLASIAFNNGGLYTRVAEAPVGTVWPVMITCKNCEKRFAITIFNRGVCPRCGYKN